MRKIVAFLALSLVALGVTGLAASDPGFLVALVPGATPGPMLTGRVLQVFGVLLVAVPLIAASMIRRQGGRWLFGVFVAVTVIAAVPAVVAINHGSDQVRRAVDARNPAPEPCAEFSGGDNRCPGG